MMMSVAAESDLSCFDFPITRVRCRFNTRVTFISWSASTDVTKGLSRQLSCHEAFIGSICIVFLAPCSHRASLRKLSAWRFGTGPHEATSCRQKCDGYIPFHLRSLRFALVSDVPHIFLRVQLCPQINQIFLISPFHERSRCHLLSDGPEKTGVLSGVTNRPDAVDDRSISKRKNETWDQYAAGIPIPEHFSPEKSELGPFLS
ncbi:polyketide synthase [Pseudozyma hubeiensis SY62]|uniref:Polyketide synthase n=1 Tax=Pseudozyma hubeiensis (strain SY62) TaxID=1305764 RepID=R9P626_PSEHS|nr:polyketide synthase [Pseudozyma hubeiensis SY62]GAC96796.1 polyketide synthase [Pseudozyma hubeiensis SY62]